MGKLVKAERVAAYERVRAKMGAGVTMKRACADEGVSVAAFWKWLKNWKKSTKGAENENMGN